MKRIILLWYKKGALLDPRPRPAMVKLKKKVLLRHGEMLGNCDSAAVLLNVEDFQGQVGVESASEEFPEDHVLSPELARASPRADNRLHPKLLWMLEANCFTDVLGIFMLYAVLLFSGAIWVGMFYLVIKIILFFK